MRKLYTFLMVTIFTLTGCQNHDISKSKLNNEKPSFNNATSDIQYIKSNADFYKNGVIFGKDKAMFLDFDTMEKTPLCAVPNCMHSNSSCLANIVGENPIIYNENIYYFSSTAGVKEMSDSKKFYINSKLMRASLDSSETEIVTDFSDCMPNVPSYYVLIGNELFFTGNDMCPTEDEFGVISYSTVGGTHFLCSINLDTGKYTNYGSIYNGDKEYEMADASSGANISGIYNNKMYIQYVFMKEDPQKLGINPEENWTRVNFEFDFDTKKLTESSLPAAIYMDNATYAYLDSETNTTIVINNNEKYIVPHYDLISYSAKIINNKIFFSDLWYDLSDMTEHGYGEYNGYEIVTYYDDCYILMKGGLKAKITEEELLSL